MRKTLILCSLLSAFQVMSYDFMSNGIAYNINADGETVTVTYTSFGNNYHGVTELVVPERTDDGTNSYRVTAIGSYAFNECEALKTLKIPSSVFSIGEYASFGCLRLEHLSLGDNVREIERYAFSETNLIDLSIPASVIKIGDYAFASCTRLKSVDTGNGVTQLGRGVFMSCDALTTIRLGANVTSIGVYAFSGATSLSQIICLMQQPPNIQPSVFAGVDKISCQLNVPRNASYFYEEASVWNEFINLVAMNDGLSLELDYIWYDRGHKDFRIVILLTNDIEVSAIQCDLQLPNGVTIAEGADGAKVWIDEDRRTQDHTVMVNGQTILVSSPSGRALKGNSGELVYITISVDDMALTNQDCWLRHVSLSTPDGVLIHLPDQYQRFYIYYLRGDADGDGSVDVADYVVAANMLINNYPSRYFLDAADTNQNGYLDVSDLIGISQRAMGITEPENDWH